MEYAYRCPNCGYRAMSHSQRISPECPKCRSLLEYDIREDDKEEFLGILDALGTLRVNHISKDRDVIFLDLGRSHIEYRDIKGPISDLGYDMYLREKNGLYHAFLIKKPPESAGGMLSKGYVYILLFIATVISTIYAGYVLSAPLVDEGIMGNVWSGALSFSAGLMAILVCHEMGHKVQSIKSGISSSWPYFIPMPFLPLGTLGAIIKMKSPIPTKRDAVYLGASGPLIGVLVAIPVVIIGMRMSYVVPASMFEGGGISLGNSILFTLLTYVSSVSVPEGMTLWIHPLAFAGWVGLLVTMLNLLPAGQLDGGHVVRALFGDRGHRKISSAMVWVLLGSGILGLMSEMGYLPLGNYFWSGWLMWGILVHFLTRGGHPGALNEIEPLSRNARIVAVLALITFIMCFVPVPILIQ